MSLLTAAFGRSYGLGRQPFAGTGRLLRQNVKADRISILLWIIGVGALSPLIARALSAVYPDLGERYIFTQLAGSSPAIRVMTGPVFGSSLGALVVWRIGVTVAILAGLMAIFTVIRHTRGDEETGRIDLVASGIVGRLAPLTAALMTAGIGCAGMGVVTCASVIGYDNSMSGGLLYGGSVAVTGLVFAGIAAICAQIFDSSRAAIGYAGLALGVSFAFRAIADGSGKPTWEFLRYASPLGLFSEVRAFAGNRIEVFAVLVALAILTIATAAHLLARRDISGGMITSSLGPARGHMTTAVALATRLQRSGFIGWLLALSAYGVMTGAIVDTARKMVEDSRASMYLLEALGGGSSIVRSMIGMLAMFAAILAAVSAVSAAARLRIEESSDRAGLLLATPTSRYSWLSSHVIWVLAIPAVSLVSAGVIAGLVRLLVVHAQGGGTSGVLAAAVVGCVVHIPGVWVIGALAIALFAVCPKLSGALSWSAVALSAVVGMFGSILNLPQWAIDLSPLAHTKMVPANPVPALALAALLAISAGLFALSFVVFRRRDLVPN